MGPLGLCILPKMALFQKGLLLHVLLFDFTKRNNRSDQGAWGKMFKGAWCIDLPRKGEYTSQSGVDYYDFRKFLGKISS